MITLSTFLKEIDRDRFFDGIDVVNFVGKSYQALFFSTVLGRLKLTLNRPLSMLDAGTLSLPSVQALISTSLLGQPVVYGLTGTYVEIKNQYKELYRFLYQYRSIHLIVLWTLSANCISPRSGILTVSIEETIDSETYILLCMLLQNQKIDRVQSSKLLQGKQQISVDMACLLSYYQTLLGRNLSQFYDNWLPLLVSPQHSLFLLGQHLFSQDTKKFYSLWLSCQSNYPPEFWLAFWSEQIWQALDCLVMIQQGGGVKAARQAGYRLPFSFINGDWKKHSFTRLQKAGEVLYSIDFSIKHGGEIVPFDLLYATVLGM